MADYIRADKQILVGVMGLTTSFLTGLLLGLITHSTGHALYSFSLWFIIPVGAFLAGMAAASGYYAGAVTFHQKPVGGVLLNMVAASIGAFLIVHYVPYYLGEVRGVKIKYLVSFWEYLDLHMTHTSVSTLRGRASTGSLGSMGYVYTAIQLIGFALGGLSVFGFLSNKTYCDKCSRYFEDVSEDDRYTSDSETFIDKLKNFAGFLDNNELNKAVQYHLNEMGFDTAGNHHLRTKLITRTCTGCGTNQIEFFASRLEKDDWKDIEQTRFKIFTDTKLDVISKPDTRYTI